MERTLTVTSAYPGAVVHVSDVLSRATPAEFKYAGNNLANVQTVSLQHVEGRFLRFKGWETGQEGQITLQMTEDRIVHAEFEAVVLRVDMDARMVPDVVASAELLTVELEWESVDVATHYLVYYRLLSQALHSPW